MIVIIIIMIVIIIVSEPIEKSNFSNAESHNHDNWWRGGVIECREKAEEDDEGGEGGVEGLCGLR